MDLLLQPGDAVTTPNHISNSLNIALRLNQTAYNGLAVNYETTGALRLVQAYRWLRPVLRHMNGQGSEQSILELGSADGYLTGYLTRQGYNVTAIEYATEMAAATRRNAPLATLLEQDFTCCDLDSRFDVVLGSAFVHLFPPPWDLFVLKRIRAFLAPDGVAYLATTIHDTFRTGLEAKQHTNDIPRYRSRYTMAAFNAQLRDAGFTTVSFYATRDHYCPEKSWGNWIVSGGEP